MTIIKLEPVNGIHPAESQSHRTENWMGPGWIEVPEALAGKVFGCCGYCELVLEEGILTDIIPTQRPPEPESEPTPQEDTDALLVEHEYRLTLLELGLEEGGDANAV